MAVVIQKMVHAESAGVLFSRHFLNGDPSLVVITANYGLGESVVAAKSEPDTYLIKRHYKSENVEMLASIVGEKKYIIEMDAETSIKEIELDDEKRKRCCLSTDVALKLARISVILEKFFGSPRDIEFAVTKDKRIYLLQSRAITALNNFTDYEIIHERDSAFMSCQEVLTKANVGEVLCGAVSPLTLTVVREIIDIQTEKRFHLGKETLLNPKFFPISHQHVLMDAYKLFFMGLSKDIQVMDHAMYLSVFGNNVLELHPEILQITHHRNVYRRTGNPRILQLKIFGDSWLHLNSYMKSAKDALAEMKSRLCDKSLAKHKTPTEVIILINSQLQNYEQMNFTHFASSNTSILYQIIAFVTLLYGAKEMTIEHQRYENYEISMI